MLPGMGSFQSIKVRSRTRPSSGTAGRGFGECLAKLIPQDPPCPAGRRRPLPSSRAPVKEIYCGTIPSTIGGDRFRRGFANLQGRTEVQCPR